MLTSVSYEENRLKSVFGPSSVFNFYAATATVGAADHGGGVCA